MYDHAFYDTIAQGCRDSASVVVPELVRLFSPSRVVDFGCGEGHWLAEFKAAGCEVLGMDGDHVALGRLAIERDEFFFVDLSQPVTMVSADLAISLEVAEHLPAASAAGFVASLVAAAPIVVFSAAIPGQGGTGHVNEQWPGYWVQLFASHGYSATGALRWQFWEDSRVENWYCVPDDAEILTAGGWRVLAELTGTEMVLSYSMTARRLEWEPMLGLNSFDYAGPMVTVSGRWRSTPTHRWPVFTQQDVKTKRGPRFRLAEDMVDSDRILQVADDYAWPAASVLAPLDAALLGWLVTDGTFLVKANGSPQGVIYQSPRKYLAAILALLGDEVAGVSYDARPQSHGCATVRVRTSALRRLMDAGYFGKDDLLALVLRLDRSAAEAMWHTMVLAEGTVNTGSLLFCQNPGPVFDAFQALSLLLGKRVNQGRSGSHAIGGTGNGTKSGRTVAGRSRRCGDYAGKVWCPTTRNGTWVMRQNGAVVITGNSQNLLVFASAPDTLTEEAFGLWSSPLAPPWPVVHPVLYDARRS